MNPTNLLAKVLDLGAIFEIPAKRPCARSRIENLGCLPSIANAPHGQNPIRVQPETLNELTHWNRKLTSSARVHVIEGDPGWRAILGSKLEEAIDVGRLSVSYLHRRRETVPLWSPLKQSESVDGGKGLILDDALVLRLQNNEVLRNAFGNDCQIGSGWRTRKRPNLGSLQEGFPMSEI